MCFYCWETTFDDISENAILCYCKCPLIINKVRLASSSITRNFHSFRYVMGGKFVAMDL